MNQATQLVRYWHPRKSGWYYGYQLGMDVDDDGNGMARIQCLGSSAIIQVPEQDVQEVHDVR